MPVDSGCRMRRQFEMFHAAFRQIRGLDYRAVLRRGSRIPDKAQLTAQPPGQAALESIVLRGNIINVRRPWRLRMTSAESDSVSGPIVTESPWAPENIDRPRSGKESAFLVTPKRKIRLERHREARIRINPGQVGHQWGELASIFLCGVKVPDGE